MHWHRTTLFNWINSIRHLLFCGHLHFVRIYLLWLFTCENVWFFLLHFYIFFLLFSNRSLWTFCNFLMRSSEQKSDFNKSPAIPRIILFGWKSCNRSKTQRKKLRDMKMFCVLRLCAFAINNELHDTWSCVGIINTQFCFCFDKLHENCAAFFSFDFYYCNLLMRCAGVRHLMTSKLCGRRRRRRRRWDFRIFHVYIFDNFPSDESNEKRSKKSREKSSSQSSLWRHYDHL